MPRNIIYYYEIKIYMLPFLFQNHEIKTTSFDKGEGEPPFPLWKENELKRRRLAEWDSKAWTVSSEEKQLLCDTASCLNIQLISTIKIFNFHQSDLFV